MTDPSALERRRQTVIAGHQGDVLSATAALRDRSATVRASALGALVRMKKAKPADLLTGMGDDAPEVRRRACELVTRPESASLVAGPGRAQLIDALIRVLADPDPFVAETAAFALGEIPDLAEGRGTVVCALAKMTGGHPDALCREAAVAALGAIGDPGGLEAILVATSDKPAVRRRAILALAPFDDPRVDEVLRRAGQDRDWQVRQAAEDVGPTGSPP
jgi:HEAT repeat protein